MGILLVKPEWILMWVELSISIGLWRINGVMGNFGKLLTPTPIGHVQDSSSDSQTKPELHQNYIQFTESYECPGPRCWRAWNGRLQYVDIPSPLSLGELISWMCPVSSGFHVALTVSRLCSVQCLLTSFPLAKLDNDALKSSSDFSTDAWSKF